MPAELSDPPASVRVWRPTRLSLLRGGAWGGLFSLVVFLLIWPQHQQQSERNQLLQAEVDRLAWDAKKAETLRAEIETLQARAQAVTDIQTQQLWALRMLNSLAEGQSQNTWEYGADFKRRQRPVRLVFSEVRESTEGVQITGRTESVESVAELIRHLSFNSPHFKDAELDMVILDAASPAADMPFKFTIRASINPASKPVPMNNRPSTTRPPRQDPP